jgi:hypothetical protein
MSRVNIGDRFHRLTVRRLGEPAADGHARYLCACDCGQSALVLTSALLRGKTKSCGCLRAEKAARSMKLNRRELGSHGMAPRAGPHPLYSTWAGMVARCTNPRHEKYPLYGARGITVCQRWRNDFAAFLADMGERPSPKQSLDRIDNSGNYEPGNVRWATPVEQARNRRPRRRSA